MGYKNTKKALIVHIHEDDKKKITNLKLFFPDRGKTAQSETIYINESGLYSLIISSKKKEAKVFQHWVTKDVLPTIRKTDL